MGNVFGMQRVLAADQVNFVVDQSRGCIRERLGKVRETFDGNPVSIEAQLQTRVEDVLRILSPDTKHCLACLHRASVRHGPGKMADHLPLLSARSQGKYLI